MYRLYFRDGANRRIVDFREVEAASDDEAKAICRNLADDSHCLELWAGDRLVAKLSNGS